jgi:hypothetical protein
MTDGGNPPKIGADTAPLQQTMSHLTELGILVKRKLQICRAYGAKWKSIKVFGEQDVYKICSDYDISFKSARA